MKKIQLLALLLLSQINYALEIHQIRLSEISTARININVITEADELYYFHSWRSQISNNVINIEAFYVEGFGSTIAYLNNNFEVPINPKRRLVYQLNVKIYYTNLRGNHIGDTLQDQWSGLFSTPLSTPTFLTNFESDSSLKINYQNPNRGLISLGSQKASVVIFNKNGEIVESKQVSGDFYFFNLPDGLYYFKFSYENKHKTIKIILKK